MCLLLGFLSSVEIQQRRSELFSLEQERQKQNVGRIEKIEVRYLGQPNDTTLIMNKGLSTPFNCAQRKYRIHRVKVTYEVHKTLLTLRLLTGNSRG